MQEKVVFNIVPSPDTTEKIEKIQKLFSRINVNITFDTDHLVFEYETQQVDTCLTRKAGKKQKQPNGYYTMGDIRQMQSSMSANEIAATIGLSRATYFRRLKNTNHLDDKALFQ